MTISPPSARPVDRSDRSDRSDRPKRWAVGPGLGAVAVAVAAAWGVNTVLPTVAPLTAAVALGVLAGNLRLLPAASRPGLDFAGRKLMRAGIALLGLKLALGDVLALGWPTLAVVVMVVAATFFGTQWLGRRLGLPGDQPLLIATGFAICGASAVAAMNGVTDSEEEDVVTAVALVTLCGSLAIGVLPALHPLLGLSDVQFGRWAGASVHDVGQVVAVAQTAGPTALAQAVVVKLMRVALLAPIVTGVAIARRRCRRSEGGTAPAAGRRPPLVPLFIAAFLAFAALRSTGTVPAPVVTAAEQVDELLLAAALFALGTTVNIRALLRTGRRALLVGLSSWLLIAAVAYAGVLATT
ncbi:putative integral membrane protein (TIGR00698 family) [Kitasatospora sp. MAP12-15]|uniref:YeiH family protein n=1 Tax=unclassified Kitasatospora TaxID=2633591 RepID=UPI002475F28C|nr:putative sulfate exporter family transporter [Kitasatospora sp. MAP12-44]MDH6112333.1 putative integral membrane protein (TIGR00698 family) [Kitasatospora sp. MAP12-44]